MFGAIKFHKIDIYDVELNGEQYAMFKIAGGKLRKDSFDRVN